MTFFPFPGISGVVVRPGRECVRTGDCVGVGDWNVVNVTEVEKSNGEGEGIREDKPFSHSLRHQSPQQTSAKFVPVVCKGCIDSSVQYQYMCVAG